MGGFIAKTRARFARKEDREHHFREWIKNVKTWQLILVLIPLLFLTATFLRLDHLKMNELKDAVMTADRAGENDDGSLPDGVTQASQSEITSDIESKLMVLKSFTQSHTIFSLVEKNGKTDLVYGTGPFYLEHQYNRLAAKALADAEAKAKEMGDSNPNGNIYAAAAAVCQPQAIANHWNWQSSSYINCMTTELNKHSESELTTSISADIPSTALFRYDFTSPIWAFNFAGIFMIFDLIVAIWIIIRLLVWVILRIALIFIKD